MTQNDIAFQAEVAKVQTLVDGGIRLTLDMAESAVELMGVLARCQQEGIILEVTAREWREEDRGHLKM
jgi:hypothetical protein